MFDQFINNKINYNSQLHNKLTTNYINFHLYIYIYICMYVCMYVCMYMYIKIQTSEKIKIDSKLNFKWSPIGRHVFHKIFNFCTK